MNYDGNAGGPPQSPRPSTPTMPATGLHRLRNIAVNLFGLATAPRATVAKMRRYEARERLARWEAAYARWQERCERLRPNDYGLGPSGAGEVAMLIERAKWDAHLKRLREEAR